MHDAIVKPLPLREIRLDERAQPRARIDQQVVAEYSRDINEGAVFPPASRVARGGNYSSSTGRLRSDIRDAAPIDEGRDLGFRVATTLNP